MTGDKIKITNDGDIIDIIAGKRTRKLHTGKTTKMTDTKAVRRLIKRNAQRAMSRSRSEKVTCRFPVVEQDENGNDCDDHPITFVIKQDEQDRETEYVPYIPSPSISEDYDHYDSRSRACPHEQRTKSKPRSRASGVEKFVELCREMRRASIRELPPHISTVLMNQLYADEVEYEKDDRILFHSITTPH